MSTLFKNAQIIDSSFNPQANMYVGVSGSTIDYIGETKPDKAYDEEKDMTSKVLLPGFVNGHNHGAMTLLRGIGSGLPLNLWLEKMFAVEDRLTAEDAVRGMRLAALEMIASGTTSFSDMYMFEYECAEVVGESGLKANLTRGFCGGYDNEDYTANFRRKEALKLYNDYNNAFDGRLKIDFSVHAEYTTTENFIKKVAEEAKTVNGSRIQIHLSETEREQRQCIERCGKTPTELFYDCGIFDVPTSAAHAVWVTEKDMNLLKEKNVYICHCPESNLKLQSGVAKVKDLLGKGICVCIGTDGSASNNNLNMVEELHVASILNSTLTPSECIKMATLNGAVSQGRPDTGVLEVGKKADITAVDLDKPHMTPNLDTAALLCYSAQGADVCMTMVDGKILYENGEYKTLDKDKIIYEARKSAERLYG